MFREFRNIIKQTNSRGWRLESEGEKLFLSKFDDTYNDDEFRFYVEEKNGVLEIIRAEKIRNYKKVVSVSTSHRFFLKAHELCLCYSDKSKQSEIFS